MPRPRPPRSPRNQTPSRRRLPRQGAHLTSPVIPLCHPVPQKTAFPQLAHSGNVRRLHFPRAVGAVRAAGADEQAFAGRAFVAFHPPVEPRKIDLGEVTAASPEEVATVPEILA